MRGPPWEPLELLGRATAAVHVAVVLLAAAIAPGCYLFHTRDDDGGVRLDAGSTRCGSAPCASVEPPRALSIDTAGLVGRVEAEVSGLRAVPAIDGVAFELDPCAPRREAPCASTITVAGAGADLADPAVLSGAVEASVRSARVVVRSDPCPGCDDGGEAGRLLFAAAIGEESEGFDLPLADVRVEAGAEVCRARGTIGEVTGRFELGFESVAPRFRETLDEGETARLSISDYAVRLVRSSYECVGPDLPPPGALEAAHWVIWIEGPR
jgi:hypothetical protein